MAAQKQLFKQQLDQLEITLQNPQMSVTQSVEFLKQITVVALSCISYLRDIFPPTAFTKRKLNGVPVRIIKGQDDIPGTQKLIKWIKGAFQAVQLHILKKMILVIEKSGNTLEVYTFNFVYNKEEISCQLDGEKDGLEVTLENRTQEIPADITRSVQQLIRTVLTLTTTLQPLTDGCEMNMKLEFNDEVPDDYELPECFKPVDSLGIHFPNECLTLKLGKVETKFTSLALTTKSVFDQAEDGAEEHITEDELVQPYQISGVYSPTDIPVNVTATQKSSTTNLSEVLNASLCLNEREIKCICELNDCNDIIKCVSCFKFQHRACYRLLEHTQVSRHICVDCHDSSDITKMCTDPDLINIRKRKEGALYRRALLLCLSNARVSSKTFIDLLSVTRQKAQQLINRLDIDGCLCPASGKGWLRTVKTDHLKDNVLGCNFKMPFCNDDVSNMDTEENNINTSNINKRKRLFDPVEENLSLVPEHPKRFKHLKYSLAQSPGFINKNW